MNNQYIVEYIIADNLPFQGTSRTLASVVSSLIQQGYQPYGNPYVNDVVEKQAMVKYGEKPLMRPSKEFLVREAESPRMSDTKHDKEIMREKLNYRQSFGDPKDG